MSELNARQRANLAVQDFERFCNGWKSVEEHNMSEHQHWCLGCDSAWSHPDEEEMCQEEANRPLSRAIEFKLCPPCDAPFDYHEGPEIPNEA